MKRIKLFILINLLAFPLVANRQPSVLAQTTPVIISDGTFTPSDWSRFKVISVGGTSHTVQQSLTDGNPDAFRSMTHTLPPVGAGILAEIEVTHLYLGASYDPGSQGTIDHIDYAEDGKMLSLPWPDAASITYLALVQDNRLYLSNNFIDFIGNITWESDTHTNLISNDFAADDGSGDKPDFTASGGEIQFGYTRKNTRSETLPPIPSNEDLVYEHGIDNWTVTVHSEGAPPINNAPVAKDDQIVLPRRGGKIFPVLLNDYDPDGDSLYITDYTLPLNGTLTPFLGEFEYTRTRGGEFVDSFGYTITDGELSDTGSVLLLVECGCSLACISDPIGPGGISVIGQFRSAIASFLHHSPEVQPIDVIDLALMYRVREEVMKPTPHGQRYVNMYYHTTPEILEILLVDSPALRDEAVATVELWQDNLRNLLDGDGMALVTQARIDAVDSFLTNLSAAASPELQQIIADERARLGPLQEYVGLTVKEAKTQAIGDPTVYLPLVINDQ